MGHIIKSKVYNNGIIYRMILDPYEASSLKNAVKNINIFCADLCENSAKMIQRGKKGTSKFFEIPFHLRCRRKKNMKNICYQKLETDSKIFFMYVINKDALDF